MNNAGFMLLKNFKSFVGVTNPVFQNHMKSHILGNSLLIPKLPEFTFISSRSIISYATAKQPCCTRNLKSICLPGSYSYKSSEKYIDKYRKYYHKSCLPSVSPVLRRHRLKDSLLKSYFSEPALQLNLRNLSSRNNNIQSNIGSLKTRKRIQRKKATVDELNEMGASGFVSENHKFLTFDPDFAIPTKARRRSRPREFQIVAFATADEYNLEVLSKALHEQGVYVEIPIVSSPQIDESVSSKSSSSSTAQPEDVLLFGAAYQVTTEPRTMHIFRNGVIVFWNMPSLERQNILKFVKRYQNGEYEDEMVEGESETLVYTYTSSPTRLKSNHNLILLNEGGEKDVEKFTFSNALAMSVKLGIWEASLERYIENIEHVTEELQESGVVVLNQNQVLQRLGQLFALRHLINLSSDLLDTPDFYWDHERLEALYNHLAGHLSIRKRTSVMNTKLNHCCELMELLKGHLQDKHASRLEWTIIILIMIEVFFEILHFL